MTQVMCEDEIVGEIKNQSPIELRLAGVWLRPSRYEIQFPFSYYAANQAQINEDYHIPANAEARHIKDAATNDPIAIEFWWYVFKVTPDNLAVLFDHRDFIPY